MTKKPREITFCYKIGDVIDNKILVIDSYVINANCSGGKTHRRAAYKCRCLIDGYEWDIRQGNLQSGKGCPVCGHKVVMPGINDIATTHPHLMKYFVDVADANKYSHQSTKHIDVKCPNCGYIKTTKVCNFTDGGFKCPMCSDGVSYPNKFARELFGQLSDQYDYYEYEWSPDWAGKLRYDNYVELKDGRKIVIEMDGGQHYNQTNYFKDCNTDKIKDELANQNRIEMIRVNCDYYKGQYRFEYIKSSVISSLGDIFDLSCVDWDECNKIATSSKVIEAINLYNKNPHVSKTRLAKELGVAHSTLMAYLRCGEELGLCKIEDCLVNLRPVCAENIKTKKQFMFKSIADAATYFSKSWDSMNYYLSSGKTYNDYMFKNITIEEYIAFVEKEKQQTA